jgi:hypothetical protein
MDRLIFKYYDYLRESVMRVESAERQIIGISSKFFFSAGKTCRLLILLISHGLRVRPNNDGLKRFRKKSKTAALTIYDVMLKMASW